MPAHAAATSLVQDVAPVLSHSSAATEVTTAMTMCT